jgi:hypothetical protein
MRDFIECKAYLSHLRAEHTRIRRAIQGVQREMDSAQQANDRLRITRAMLDLRRTLVHHFDQEERGGCLEEAASFCPSVATDVQAIQRQHLGLLSLLDHLIARSRELVGERDLSLLVAAFNDFIRLLRSHELAENRLLQTAFGTGEWAE